MLKSEEVGEMSNGQEQEIDIHQVIMAQDLKLLLYLKLQRSRLD